jgi:Lon protease-like protein
VPDTVANNSRLAVFPLNTVLLPGCVLPLRIFESRYLDMVSASLRDGKPFVIVQARADGSDEPDVADSGDIANGLHFFNTGCEAEVVDFDRADDGVLSILVRGRSRVQLSESRQQSNGLWTASADPLPEWGALPDDTVPSLRDLLNQLLQHDQTKRLLDWISLDDQEAVMNHLVMLLPLSKTLKQALLEADDLAIRWQGIEDAIDRLEAQGAAS